MDIKLNDKEKKILEALAYYPDQYSSFKGIAQSSEVDLKDVRRNVRSLARKGLAQYAKGLINEHDDSLGGAGYGITDAGQTLAEKLEL